MNIKETILNDYNDFITSNSYNDLWLSFSKKEIDKFLIFLGGILSIDRNRIIYLRITATVCFPHNGRSPYIHSYVVNIKEDV